MNISCAPCLAEVLTCTFNYNEFLGSDAPELQENEDALHLEATFQYKVEFTNADCPSSLFVHQT